MDNGRFIKQKRKLTISDRKRLTWETGKEFGRVLVSQINISIQICKGSELKYQY